MPAEELENLNAPSEIVEQIRAKNSSVAAFYVMPENWQACLIFMRLGTQWIVSPTGEVGGLNYTAVEILFKMERVKNRKQIFEDIQTIEAEVVKIFREKRSD